MQQRGQSNHVPGKYRPHTGKSLLMRILPWALIAIVAASGTLYGMKALRDKQVADEVAPYADVFADNISIDGVNLAGMTAQEAYDTLYQKQRALVNGWQLALTFRGHTYATANYQMLGIDVQSAQLVEKLKSAWDLTHSGDNYQKKSSIDALKAQPYAAFTTQSELSDRRLGELLQAIADNISSTFQARDAKLLQFMPDSTDPFLIQGETAGYSLDVEKAKGQIMAMAATGVSGSYELVPDIISPQVTQAQIRQSLTLRAEAQTSIDKSSPDNRTNNIRVSLGKVNGIILKPGETFSFNQVVGKRTHENGFFDALEYVSGDLVTGIGGGVCQSSTTIYQAALLAGLGGMSRTSHSDPVNYTEKGLDATVYYYGGRQIDYKFKNTTGADLYITAHVLGSSKRNLVARVRIYGESLGEGVRFGLRTQLIETLIPSPEIIYKKDTNAQHVLYKDETELISKERDGYVVETYLEKYVNGQLAESKWISKDTYKARQRVEWIGTQDRL